MVLHMCMNIEGAIRNAKDLKGCIEVNGKALNTVEEIRDWLRKWQSKGYLVLPMSDCSNFDFQKGCQGHTEEEAKEHKAICKIARAICNEEHICQEWCGTYTQCKAYQEAKRYYEERKNNEYIK